MNPDNFVLRKLAHKDWMALSPSQRFCIGAAMFDLWRARLIATFPPGLSPREFKRLLYERTYGQPAPTDAFPE